MRSTESYSELECLVLGLVALGATNGYAMRKTMQGMWGNRWSVESGSIYRALRRLETDELVRVAGRSGVPNRQRIEYTLTRAGEVVLHSWLGRVPASEEFLQISDSIRTRSFFLDLLPLADRMQTVRAWASENRSLLRELRRRVEEEPESELKRCSALTALTLQVEARQEWLRKLLDALKKSEAAEATTAES
jgi:DNA-binding PadR family transcriptional regulator